MDMPAMQTQDNSSPPRRRGRFLLASGLLKEQVRRIGESRGFAVARLLTRWPEIVGEETARIARPVKVSHPRSGLGATLTILTTGPHAPMLQAETPRIIERVNACYGYAAISRIRITQTAPTGFAEGQAAFSPPPPAGATPPEPETPPQVREAVRGIRDPALRAALERLGTNIMYRTRNRKVTR